MALTAPRPDGLPRDVIVKPHFYHIKEKIMLEVRHQGDISISGHSIQIFADIAQTTIQKRRALKPLLNQLINRQIKYRWSFPFRLSFSYKGKSHSFANFQSSEALLQDLGLISTEPQMFSAPVDERQPISPRGLNREDPEPGNLRRSLEQSRRCHLRLGPSDQFFFIIGLRPT